MKKSNSSPVYSKPFRQMAYAVGGLLMVAGALLYVTRWAGASWLFIAGALLFGGAQLADKYTGDSFVVRRLRRQQMLASLLLVATGVLMLTLSHNEWVVCLLVAAVIELYTSFRIPHELEKASGGSQKK